LVDSNSKGASNYQPEIGMCKFFDTEFPESVPNKIFAYYAREWTIKGLSKFYDYLVTKYKVDAVICFDGGTDSLMVGDESGLGDPIEDGK
jgi:hypothetical protein